MKFYNEKNVSILSVLSGIFIAFSLSLVPLLLHPPKSWNDFLYLLLGNFASYWIPQACILGLLWLFNARPGVIAGTAGILAPYLGLFYIWFYFQGHPESMAWLGISSLGQGQV